MRFGVVGNRAIRFRERLLANSAKTFLFSYSIKQVTVVEKTLAIDNNIFLCAYVTLLTSFTVKLWLRPKYSFNVSDR